MTTTAKKQMNANGNGKADAEATLAEAIAYEQAIADEAAEIRGDATDLTPALYLALRPLLRRPIPAALIESTGVTTGKPYESTGIRSLQVSIDRLDNVLTPFGWGYEYEYLNDGKLCHLTCWAGRRAAPLFDPRESWGGVKQGSNDGNIHKGSFTNTAKRGFAEAFGVGHEIYLGAADFDPDTDKATAELQAKADGVAPDRKLPKEKVESLTKIIAEAGLADHLDLKLRSFGVASIADLSVEQGIELYEWVQQEASGG